MEFLEIRICCKNIHTCLYVCQTNEKWQSWCSSYIIRRLVLGTFTDKCWVSDPLDIVIEALVCQASVTDIVITLLAVVFCVLVNHVGNVVFILSYLQNWTECSVYVRIDDVGNTDSWWRCKGFSFLKIQCFYLGMSECRSPNLLASDVRFLSKEQK